MYYLLHLIAKLNQKAKYGEKLLSPRICFGFPLSGKERSFLSGNAGWESSARLRFQPGQAPDTARKLNGYLHDIKPPDFAMVLSMRPR